MGGPVGPMEEAVREFLAESRENLDQFETHLLAAEAEPGSRNHLAALFRTIHSVKGGAGFLGFQQLETVVHAGEMLLAKLRDGHVALTPQVTSALLAMVDVLRRMIRTLEATRTEGDVAHESIVERLQRALAAGEDVPAPALAAAAAAPAGDEAGIDGKIRVSVQLLDRMMNLVGELVLARNQLVQLAQRESAMLMPAQRLSTLISGMQEAVLKTRMQPISTVWNRFPRLIRDLAKTAGKHVRLELEGKDTELDKSLVEAIQEPLTHIVRNAIDHGIETADVRRARGKPDEGVIWLRAYHEGGMVNVEIADDGAGIDVDIVRRKAIESGRLTEDIAARLGEREVLRLLFLPGFSTARQVTTLSGRGVGMDVVLTNVEQVGGTVDVESRLGHGTTVKIKIPLTLAIIPALIVSTHGERYALPQASLLEVVRIDAGDASTRIEHVHGAPVFRLRGKLLPLAYLARELGEPATATPASLAIVVMRVDDRSFGLVVDEIHDIEEIVVKPLWPPLKRLGVYAGVTVMGDGLVGLILDPMALGTRVGAVRERVRTAGAQETAPVKSPVPEELVLLCRSGTSGRMAIPLSYVARLEEIARSRIEHVGGHDVIEYRGEIVRLVDVGAALEERRLVPRDDTRPVRIDESPTVPVVMHSQRGRSIGLAVDELFDIVKVQIALQREGTRRGVLGSMVVNGRITEFLDVEQIVRLSHPSFLEDR